MIHALHELIERARKGPRCTIAVAAAEDRHVLEAIQAAMLQGIVRPLLVGHRTDIERIAQVIGFSLEGIEIVDHDGDAAASARITVSKIRSGEADILMKGRVATSDLLKAVLDKEAGLRTEQLLSHVAFFQSPYYHKLLCVTDVAMNIAPGLEEKAQIIKNAVSACHFLGIANPKVAVAAAVEKVNPKMEATLHAAQLKQRNLERLIEGCIVDGPFAIDIAVNADAARNKGIESEVAGDCDIILAPDIEAGNMFYKALNFLGGATVAAVVMGAAVPIVLTSRSDDDRSKLFSIALAACLR